MSGLDAVGISLGAATYASAQRGVALVPIGGLLLAVAVLLTALGTPSGKS